MSESGDRAGALPDWHCRRAIASTAILPRPGVSFLPRASGPSGRGWSRHAPPSRQRRLIRRRLHRRFWLDQFPDLPLSRLFVIGVDPPTLLAELPTITIA